MRLVSSYLVPSCLRCPVAYVFSTHVSLTSHLGIYSGDQSFLLVRERSATNSSGEHLALHGTFDLSDVFVHERLHRTLRPLATGSGSLTLDLRGVCALDEAFLLRLLKTQRELAPHRAVSFEIAEDGPVRLLIKRLGLEASFGLEPARPQPKPSPTALPPMTLTRRPQWAINESH